ncbi:MAG: preprotein translocase subunit SecG [Fimbriimonadaceae bacterium]|nr:preprotein translocase subunit SecG [Alphaproteobacteria bacterium]
METVIITVHLMIVLAMIGTVLLQRSEGGALGIGGGGGGGFMSGRGAGDILTRTTAILAAGFFATSIGLTLLASQTGGGPGAILEGLEPQQSAPAVPGTEGGDTGTEGGQGSGVLDMLRQPSQPSGPQVPQSE